MIAVEQALARDLATLDDLAERRQIDASSSPRGVEALAGGRPAWAMSSTCAPELLEGAAARALGGERHARDLGADALMVGDRPVLDEVPGGVERVVVIEDARPRRRGSAQMLSSGPPSAPRISRKLLRRTSGKAVERWSVQSERSGFSPGEDGELALEEVAGRRGRRHRCSGRTGRRSYIGTSSA
jgi:hypothetical protein